jgi:hypothetical protein
MSKHSRVWILLVALAMVPATSCLARDKALSKWPAQARVTCTDKRHSSGVPPYCCASGINTAEWVEPKGDPGTQIE